LPASAQQSRDGEEQRREGEDPEKEENAGERQHGAAMLPGAQQSAVVGRRGAPAIGGSVSP